MTRPIAPQETRPARLQPLAKLPVFLNLQGKRAVLAGGGEPCAWKAELLAAAGARVEVFAKEVSPELAALLAAPSLAPEAGEGRAGIVTLVPHPWTPDDLDGAAVAVGEIEDEAEAVRFAACARARGVPVNVIDRPTHCDFQFGAIVNRSPVIVAISTDGAAPILGQALRRRIEALLPAGIGAWSALAKGFRERLAEQVPSKAGRRRFWEAFVDVVFISTREEDARLEELERLAQGAAEGGGSVGSVALVGAGPGNPDLLTLRAVRALQSADVIVYDRLVTPEILELARREARRIRAGKAGHGDSCRQDDINRLIVELALAGNRVVRLKGGDPSVFGRSGEEIAACRGAGVPVTVVPGITAASAAAASLTASLTHRDHAQRVQLVTAHDRHGRPTPDLDLDALADPKATTCIYMARRAAGDLARRMVERGLDPGTPAAVVSDVSLPGEQAQLTTLGALAGDPDLGGDRPTVVLVGAAVARDREPAVRPRTELVHAASAGEVFAFQRRLDTVLPE